MASTHNFSEYNPEDNHLLTCYWCRTSDRMASAIRGEDMMFRVARVASTQQAEDEMMRTAVAMSNSVLDESEERQRQEETDMALAIALSNSEQPLPQSFITITPISYPAGLFYPSQFIENTDERRTRSVNQPNPRERLNMTNPGERPNVSNPGGRPNVSNPGGRPNVSNPGERPNENNPGERPNMSNPGGRPNVSNPRERLNISVRLDVIEIPRPIRSSSSSIPETTGNQENLRGQKHHGLHKMYWKYRSLPIMFCDEYQWPEAAVTTQLRELKIHRGNEDIVEWKPGQSENDRCLICLTNVATRIASPCGHKQSCRECIGRVLTTTKSNKRYLARAPNGEMVPTQYQIPVRCLVCRCILGIIIVSH